MSGSQKSGGETPLRSKKWLCGNDKGSFVARSYMKKLGLTHEALTEKPIIGICNTWSELNPCNSNLRELAECVRAGIQEAGGIPVEFPVMSLGEPLMRPTAMMHRNLASMDVEETIRSNPVDGVVLLAGCDKTTPALVMGAASCDVPAILVSAGPMLNGKWHGKDIGSGTHMFGMMDDFRLGRMSEEELHKGEEAMSRSAGTCNTMGTASTMACLMETMGLSLPGNGTLPAPDSRRKTLAHQSGERIVEMVLGGLNISKILKRESFENAIMVGSAIGGSTNAVVHLLAIAGRLAIDLKLDDWSSVGGKIPCILNLMPSGKYLMEDFHYAGGLSALMNSIGDSLDLSAPTVSGVTLGDQVSGSKIYNTDVIKPLADPVAKEGGIAVLRGNLAPKGAVLKTSAASQELFNHKGRAVVFENIDDYTRRIDDPDLDVNPEDILVLKNCGPVGYAGFPEVGNMALPAKLLAQGVNDMVRISDSRMSGTAFGTVILHVAPEAAVGGPLSLVRDGDQIELDIERQTLNLAVTEGELEARRKKRTDDSVIARSGGYEQLFKEHVLQADEGCDFDFLRGCRGASVGKSYL